MFEYDIWKESSKIGASWKTENVYNVLMLWLL